VRNTRFGGQKTISLSWEVLIYVIFKNSVPTAKRTRGPYLCYNKNGINVVQESNHKHTKTLKHILSIKCNILMLKSVVHIFTNFYNFKEIPVVTANSDPILKKLQC
jgi:hypothetical protein